MPRRDDLDGVYLTMLYRDLGQKTCFSPRKVGRSHKKMPRSMHKKNLLKAFNQARE
jgi:hypothetical protein